MVPKSRPLSQFRYSLHPGNPSGPALVHIVRHVGKPIVERLPEATRRGVFRVVAYSGDPAGKLITVYRGNELAPRLKERIRVVAEDISPHIEESRDAPSGLPLHSGMRIRRIRRGRDIHLRTADAAAAHIAPIMGLDEHQRAMLSQIILDEINNEWGDPARRGLPYRSEGEGGITKTDAEVLPEREEEP